jgi:hypothetical protein
LNCFSGVANGYISAKRYLPHLKVFQEIQVLNAPWRRRVKASDSPHNSIRCIFSSPSRLSSPSRHSTQGFDLLY